MKCKGMKKPFIIERVSNFCKYKKPTYVSFLVNLFYLKELPECLKIAMQ